MPTGQHFDLQRRHLTDNSICTIYARNSCRIVAVPLTLNQRPTVVAVTGAQGVGKSTFCRRLRCELSRRGFADIRLIGGLGDRLRTLGVPLGTASTEETIPAVFAAHLEREREITGGQFVLDRCLVDALAYARVLKLNNATFMRLYEGVTALSIRTLNFVVYLELSPSFEPSSSPHETPDLRRRIAEEIPKILEELGCPTLRLDASQQSSVARAADLFQSCRNDGIKSV